MKHTAVEFLQELNVNVELTEDDFRKAIEMEIRQTQDACTEAYDLRKNIEISDEEIKKAAHEHGYEHHSFDELYRGYYFLLLLHLIRKN